MTGSDLRRGARSPKIAAVLPPDLRDSLDATALLIGPGVAIPPANAELAKIRHAIRNERKMEISYRDLKGAQSRRTIWPFALGYFDRARVLVAWCEMRKGFRHFRTDRMSKIVIAEQRYPRRREALLKEWREVEGIPPQ